MHWRIGWIVCFSVVFLSCSAEEPWQPERISTAVATVGCGNGTVEASEECDGASDSACPGQCSAQCACPGGPPRANLEFHAMDIGQGDGLLVLSPDGFVMMIDSGVDSSSSKVSSYLASLGITDIDYTVVSHMHADHLGATDKVLQQFPDVVACFDNGRTAGTVQYQEYDSAAGSRRVTVGPGDTIDMGPSIQVDVLHGDAGASNENDNSVVLRITHGSNTILSGGDCEEGCESEFDPGPIDVYKAHHHGSRTGSSDLLLSRMQATTALISAGTGNTYGHPHQEVLAALSNYGITVHRTDLEGDLVVQSDGVAHVVNGQLSCTNGSTRSCGQSDVGACQLGTQTCTGGSWGVCSGEVGPTTEDCGNGLDDDCDGQTDGADCDCGGCVSHLMIAQVAYDTPGTDSVEEFVDLYNPNGASVDLGGWSLADNAGSWTFPGGTTIAAGSYLTVARDTSGFAALHGFDPDVSGMSIALNNGGDKLDLRDDTGATVDHVAWESFEAGWTITAPIGDSIERVDLSSDSDTAADWGVTSPASPRGGPTTCSADADCDNGIYCDGVETCHPTQGCQPGTPVSCDDGIACTADSCNEATDSCDAAPNDAACDNGQFCDGAETCNVALGCQAGTPVSCDDGFSCTVDSCNEATDSCDRNPDNGACDDGLFCNGGETCDVMTGCQSGTDPCGGQVCNEATDTCGCTSNAECDDGVYCNGAEQCVAGSCQTGTAVSCDDGIACTVDACNEATDSCDYTGDDAVCDNGLFCDGAETCDLVLGCQAAPAVDCSGWADSCNDGVCNEATDSCEAAPVIDGQVCDNGDACGIDTCQAGVCQAAPCGGLDHPLIVQVSYDTPGTDSKEEFVELYNPSASAMNLDGWSLEDNQGSWSFPGGTVIAAGDYLTVARRSNGFRSLYGSNPDVSGLSLSLGNSGDIVSLRDDTGTVVDEVAWEDYLAGWSIAASTGNSIVRSDPGLDTDTASDWVVQSPSYPLGW